MRVIKHPVDPPVNIELSRGEALQITKYIYNEVGCSGKEPNLHLIALMELLKGHYHFTHEELTV